MPTLRADNPIQYVKGVGPRRAADFATLGIHTVGDLLSYFPFRHEADQGETDIVDLYPGMTATIRGEVVRLGGRYPSRRCVIDDGTETCVLRWFGENYSARKLFRGATVVATGRAQVYGNGIELVQPRIQIYESDARLAPQQRGRRLVGVYRANKKLKSPAIRRVVLNVLSSPTLPVEEVLPERLREKHGLPTREQAVRHMHAPPDEKAYELARNRLAYEELLTMELALALRRQKRLALQDGQKLPLTPEIDRRIRARYPFKLTAAQDKVIKEIVQDLGSGRPMTRLLQGDVGSGKTVVALYAALVAIANKRQAAIMAPTEILAQQHFQRVEQYLRDSRVRYALLRGGMKRTERTELLRAVERGELDLIIGTQAIIQKDVAFHDLALVVVDEQHKFGVLQRHKFRTKGPLPHYLVMTATPIPRTLAMTVFGDLDVSIIRQSPPGRGKIITKLVQPAQWPTVMGYVRQRLEAGEQAYVVCPLIGKDNDAPADAAAAQARTAIASVRATYEQLATGPFAGLKIGLLHGGLRAAEKDTIIADFAAGTLAAIVSTTVVEVGVDVANATIMIIENADRYGLSQLHQLRGRVGRGDRDSLCVLIARKQGVKAVERLGVMIETTDGFRIAEADLQQRGPGQLFGTRQHGLPELHIASIVSDFALLDKAREDAFAIARSDPRLARPEHRILLPSLRRMFGDKLSLIDAA